MTRHHKVYSTSIRMYAKSICTCVIMCHKGVVIVNGDITYPVVALPGGVHASVFVLCHDVSHGHWEARYIHSYLITAILVILILVYMIH